MEFKFIILHSNYQEKTYTFKKVSFAPKRTSSWEDTKKHTFEMRSEFEVKIKSLKKIFLELISISETFLESRKWNIKTIGQIIVMLIILVFTFILYYPMNPEGAIIRFSIIPIVIVSVLIYVKIKKLKEKKKKTENS